MRKQKPILQILAGCTGVYEIRVTLPANDYGKAERLSAAIQPAIAIIDRAIGVVFGGASAPDSRGKEKTNV